MSDAVQDVHPRIRQSLQDLLDQAAVTARLVARGKRDYDSDEMLRLAAESLVIRMGECVDRIDKADPAFVDAHPLLELRRLKDTRNVLAHGYDIVDHDLVWSILVTNIPTVAENIGQFLSTGVEDGVESE